jgi:hypothetical protein
MKNLSPAIILPIHLPTMRPFSWKALWILVALQLLGNLLSIPILQTTNRVIDPLPYWILWTAISIPIIALSLYLAGRIGLSAPFLEGYLHGEGKRNWLQMVVAISVLVAIAAIPFILLINQDAGSQDYPAVWKLILASMDAGVQEEIFNRFFLMTALAWLGSLIWSEPDGRPTRLVIWTAILISAILFGWAHVDDKLSIPGVPISDFISLMVVGTIYGIIFGWLYWKLGIECAILAHFAIDAVASGIVVPAYSSGNLFVQVITIVGFILTALIAWCLLKRSNRVRSITQ